MVEIKLSCDISLDDQGARLLRNLSQHWKPTATDLEKFDSVLYPLMRMGAIALVPTISYNSDYPIILQSRLVLTYLGKQILEEYERMFSSF